MRTIDADALLKEYDGAEYSINESAYARGCNDVVAWSRRTISEAPTIDAVPVVRCEECKHLMFSDCYGECGKAIKGIVNPDNFCSYGERKESK